MKLHAIIQRRWLYEVFQWRTNFKADWNYGINQLWEIPWWSSLFKKHALNKELIKLPNSLNVNIVGISTKKRHFPFIGRCLFRWDLICDYTLRWFMCFSNFSPVFCIARFVKWPYVSEVVIILEWPNFSWISFRLAFASIKIEAWVWRNPSVLIGVS